MPPPQQARQFSRYPCWRGTWPLIACSRRPARTALLLARACEQLPQGSAHLVPGLPHLNHYNNHLQQVAAPTPPSLCDRDLINLKRSERGRH